jgi:hypothetical protein
MQWFGPFGLLPLRIQLTGPVSSQFTISGATKSAGDVVTERTASLVPPISWQPLQTNRVPGGPFSFVISQQGGEAAAFLRVRGL